MEGSFRQALRAGVGVAWAEMRSARRLARTWLFIVLSLGGGLLAFFGLTVMQVLGSTLSPSFAAFGPRFLVASVGVFVLWLFMVALLFLAFDVRARDRRDRMVDVLDSRPVGNLALLSGRLAGLVLTVWLPLVVLIGLFQGFGMLARALEWPFGDPLEPLSALAFLTIDALPMLALWCALVILLAVVLRNRLVVALVAIAILGAHWWVLTRSPGYLLPVVSGLTGYTVTPSDVQPVFAAPTDIAQRLALLLLAGGLLVLAAAVHPRPDRASAQAQLAGSAALLVAGCAVLGGLGWRAVDALGTRDAWRAAHEARQDSPAPALERVEGLVHVDPGGDLTLDLDLSLRTAHTPIDEIAFAFNPAMTVTALAVNGAPVSFTHEHGLLIAALPTRLQPGESIVASIAANGVPDTTFGYLDSAVDVPRLTADAGNLLLLGAQTGVFDDAYVALMPAMQWLPMPGPATGRDAPGRYGADFFSVDLAVQTPPEWLVAGPGLRHGEAGAYRFRPDAPVSAVALLAAPFERRAAEIGGIEVELLTSPKHRRNVAFFAEAADAIREELEGMFEAAESLGVGYPYRALSMVEVPAGLRSFGGGWRMASVQAMPGIVLLREYGFPTARFEMQFRNPERFQARDGGIGAAKAAVLHRYFDNDITGGNPFQGAVRNLLNFQTGAVGEGALALDFMLHELALRLFTKSRNGYFSAYAFANSTDLGLMMQQAFMGVATGSGAAVAGNVREGATRRATVWDRALGAALVDLDPRDDPQRALDVLWLKVPAVARSILDAFGREAVGSLLAELRRRYAGRNFTVAEFDALTVELGVPLQPVVGDWLRETALPGFLASPPTVVRLREDDRGRPRYQVRVHVRNDEAAPGVVRLWANVAVDGERVVPATTEPVAVGGGEAVELGLVIGGPPEGLMLKPVLALNRRDVRLGVPDVEEGAVADAEPFNGWRASEWAPAQPDGVVVDDLDAGFAVRYDDADRGLRLEGGTPSGMFALPVDMDQGLPVFSPFAPAGQDWTRQELAESFGKYRRTTARIRAGDGRAKAAFTARLPHAGRWRIDYHLPDPADSLSAFGGNVRQGLYRFEVVAAGASMAVEFDADAAEWGWNDLGSFDLPGGEVALVVSNATTGAAVFADAVRWRSAD